MALTPDTGAARKATRHVNLKRIAVSMDRDQGSGSGDREFDLQTLAAGINISTSKYTALKATDNFQPNRSEA